MTLAAGVQLGPYEILAAIGAGGMGEVYRARDTKLGRDVAIKVLPESLAHDPERLARFKREAHLLASLNHPHIAHIHGFEDSTDTPALVMELVEGPTLADRLAQGPLPLDEALTIGRQIAEALESAHEQGIVHRDLKPANVKVRDDGTVKVLDFGLAKALEPGGHSRSPSQSTTITATAITERGVILGTRAYMSPEQANGRAVDRRSDVWAFGCVLYEMLTGRRAFGSGEAVIMKASDWGALPSATPLGLRRLLGKCLEQDPRRRLQAIGDARVQIEDLLTDASEDIVPPPIVRVKPWWRRAVIPAATGLAMSLATAAIVWFAARSTIARPRVSRLVVAPPTGAAISSNVRSRDVAITPDGSRLVYVGGEGTTLFVRPLDQLEATPLVRGRSGALRDPFVSPDCQWVGFFDGLQTLKKVAITGGPAVLVTNNLVGSESGATWMADGTIIFADSAFGLKRVSADGGTPAVLTRPDRTRGEASHAWPERLPGGQAVLCTLMATTGGPDAASIAVLDLRSGRLTILLRGGTHAQYSPSGQLVYAAAGTLRAVAFDLSRLTVVGPSSLVVPQARTTLGGGVDAGLAADGTLVYVAGGSVNGLARTLVWIDRQGRETPIGAPQRAYFFPRVSPDGTRIAVQMLTDQNLNIWIWDLTTATLQRVTSEGADLTPVWTSDGRRVMFSSNRMGKQFDLFSQAADGTGAVERLSESPNMKVASAVLPDGTRVVLTERSPTTGDDDLMALRLDGTHQILPLVQTPFNERNGIVSPDGRWLAYEADDSGTFEIYVRPFPAVNSGRWQISTSGGTQPLWARSGRELFYFAPDGALMRVAVASESAWTVGAPTKVLEGRYVTSELGLFQRNYDITADGQRFLMIKAPSGDATGAPPQIVVVEHFDEELRRLVPAK